MDQSGTLRPEALNEMDKADRIRACCNQSAGEQPTAFRRLKLWKLSSDAGRCTGESRHFMRGLLY